MHVYLNPEDLVLMARGLAANGLVSDAPSSSFLLGNTKELFDQSIVIIDYERNKAPLPRIRFSLGPAGCCPFLENRLIDEGADAGRLLGLCSLHPKYKPLVCWLAPLNRTVDLAAGTETWGFVPPLPGCPGCREAVSQESGIPAAPVALAARLKTEERFFRKLSEMLESGKSHDEIISKLYYIDID